MIYRALVLAMLGAVAVGCSSSAQITEAQRAVSTFHEQLDAGRFDEIYRSSSNDLKKMSSQAEFVSLLAAVHRKLGTTRSADSQGWNVNYRPSGTLVTLTYKTAYTQGDAAEQFAFAMRDDAAVLVGYHINSNALILN
jgi:opacity protein-like surface antigen